MDSLVQDAVTRRPIIHRTSGHTEGRITRLVSPGDLGEVLKPFVFLDLFDNGGRPSQGFGLHPHSGIATLTYVAEGGVGFEDTNGSRGLLPAGGVEWMRAGSGVWHGGGKGAPAVPAASSSGSRCRPISSSGRRSASIKAPTTCRSRDPPASCSAPTRARAVRSSQGAIPHLR